MTTDPFTALTMPPWAGTTTARAPHPLPMPSPPARIVHAIVSEWTTDSEMIAAVGGRVLMEPELEGRHLFIVIRPDGAVVVPDVSGRDRGNAPTDGALGANLRAWLGPPRT